MSINQKRFLIKLSGEVLKGPLSSGISWETVDALCIRLAGIIKKTGAHIGFVIGGGNIFRGVCCDIEGYDRLYGDKVGMMATVMNGLALTERLRHHGIYAVLQSGVNIDGVAGLFDRDQIENAFSRGGCVVFCGGIGNPYFSTDTTAALRSLQINADCVFKATKVDGIYDSDPAKNSDAKKYNELTYAEIIDKRLEVMDLTAMQLMMKNNMKLMVFSMTETNSLEDACSGRIVGTIVKK